MTHSKFRYILVTSGQTTPWSRASTRTATRSPATASPTALGSSSARKSGPRKWPARGRSWRALPGSSLRYIYTIYDLLHYAYLFPWVQDVRGIRAPFLAIGGNNMFSMLYEANFTYDSSMPIYDNKPPTFPYTMDYKLAHDCMIPPCPNKVRRTTDVQYSQHLEKLLV